MDRLRIPWTLSFLMEWLPHMDLRSALRLRTLAIDNGRGWYPEEPVRVELRTPIRGPVFLRTRGTDLATLAEIVKKDVYRSVLGAGITCRSVIDLGSNIGLASLYFASAFPACRILAVEPNLSSYRLLERNMQPLIAEKRAQVIRAAVWSTDTLLAGWDSEVPDLFSGFKVRDSGNASEHSIPGRSMASLMAEFKFDAVDLLKVDVEGSEVELFRGDSGWLERVGAIAIEFHEDSRAVSRFDDVVRRFGFHIQDEGGHTVVAVKRATAGA